MTINDIKKAIREIEISYDYNHSKNDYDIVLNLTELANLIKTLQDKAIDDLLYKMLEKGIIDLYQYNEMRNFAEKLKAGGENE